MKAGRTCLAEQASNTRVHFGKVRQGAESIIQIVDARGQVIALLCLLDRREEKADKEGQAVLVHGVDICLAST